MRFVYTWEWRMRTPPERLWPLVSDTDRFNALAGVPPVEVVDDDSVRPPSHLLKLRIGGQTIVWEEEPFEWIRPERFRIVRRYRKGPVALMVVTLTLTALPEGGSRLTYRVEAEPANPLGWLAIPLQIGLISRIRFARAFRFLDEFADRRGDADASERPGRPTTFRLRDPSLLELSRQRLIALGFEASWVDRLVDYIQTAPDSQVDRMNPLPLARRWGADPEAMVKLFLYASRVGLLDMQWSVVCPSCHDVKVRAGRLADLPTAGECPLCRIAYELDFEHTVQVTFRPHPAIREVHTSVYCIGGPRNTPHILAQQRLAPGETKAVPLDLEAGEYRLRWPTHPQWQEAIHSFTEWQVPRPWQARLVVDPLEVASEAELSLRDGAFDPPGARLRTGRVVLHIRNEDTVPHWVGVERVLWSEDTLTAARMLTLQPFRDLFPFESLRRGMQIHVSSVAVLFTDLCGSTAFYRRVGDGPAFDRVAAHFEILRRNIEASGGAVVKTIGDAVMGAFPTPQAGVMAAVRILREVAVYNAAHDDWRLCLRLGLNAGPALVVNLNERLDYFGRTVNLAAKLERFSRGNELVLPAELASSVPEWPPDACVREDVVTVPGEDAPVPILRVRVEP